MSSRLLIQLLVGVASDIALSTKKAEYIALSLAAKEAMLVMKWILQLHCTNITKELLSYRRILNFTTERST